MDPTALPTSLSSYNDEETAYVFLLAVLLICLCILLLVHLCTYSFSQTKPIPQSAAARHGDGSDAPFLSLLAEAEADEGDGSSCVVCLCSMEEGAARTRVLPRCGHAFHVGCIGRWLTAKPACPLCRTPAAEGAEPPLAAPQRPRMEGYGVIAGDLYVPVAMHSYFL